MNQAPDVSTKTAKKQAIHRRADGWQTVVDLSEFERNFRSRSGHYVVYRNIAPLDNHPWEWTLTDRPAEGESIYKGHFTLWTNRMSIDDPASQPVYKHSSQDGVTEYSQALDTVSGESVEARSFRPTPSHVKLCA